MPTAAQAGAERLAQLSRATCFGGTQEHGDTWRFIKDDKAIGFFVLSIAGAFCILERARELEAENEELRRALANRGDADG